MTTRYKPTRRAMLAGAAAFPLLTMLKWPASAAEFELKYATGQDPTHPVNLRAQEALTRNPRGDLGPGRDQALSGQPARLRHGPTDAGP